MSFDIPWGPLRGALADSAAGDPFPLRHLLQSLPQEGEHAEILGSYLEGKVRENPALLKGWPLEVWGVPLKELLGPWADWRNGPDAVRHFWGNCRLQGTPATLPFRPLFLPRVSRIPEGWDHRLWGEVRGALTSGVGGVMRYQLLYRGGIPEVGAPATDPVFLEQQYLRWESQAERFFDVVEGMVHEGFCLWGHRIQFSSEESFHGQGPWNTVWNNANNLLTRVLKSRPSSFWALVQAYRLDGLSPWLSPSYRPEVLFEEAAMRLYSKAWDQGLLGEDPHDIMRPFLSWNPGRPL
jgi:hypothetical protein